MATVGVKGLNNLFADLGDGIADGRALLWSVVLVVWAIIFAGASDVIRP